MTGTIAMASLLFLVIYGPGPAWLPGKATDQQPLREHGRYMMELHERQVLREAGGFVDADGGAAVIFAANEDEARAIAEADPAVEQGIMRYTLRQWAPQDWARIRERAKARERAAAAPPPEPAAD